MNIPEELKAKSNWLVWRFEQREGRPKPLKVPYYAEGGRRVGQQGTDADRSKLVTFDTAQDASIERGMSGVGLAMLDGDIVALDFDDCVYGGEIDPEVEEIIKDTYAEFSPSGNGIRAFVRGSTADRKSRSGPGSFGFETFCRRGFVTVTGKATGVERTHLGGVTPECERLIKERFGAVEDGSGTASDPADRTGLTEHELAEIVSRSKADCSYADWLKVGMICHHEAGGEMWGFDIWDDWSHTGGDYYGRDGMMDKWRSFGQSSGPMATVRALGVHGAPTPLDEFEDQRPTDAAGQPMVQVDDVRGVLLDPKDVMACARAFSRAMFTVAGEERVIRVNALWYEYQGSHWSELPEEGLRSKVWTFLDKCLKEVVVTEEKEDEDGKKKKVRKKVIEPFAPSLAQIGAVADALRAVSGKGEVMPPCWLPGFSGRDPNELAGLQDGLLHIPTRELIPYSTGFFALNALPYAWGTGEGTASHWLTFLGQVWPGDQEAIDTLQEMFGYLLTPDTSQQKMFMILGQRRSGKGTIGRILTRLIGQRNVASPPLGSLAGDFGLEDLIGKLVALIPDARLSGRSDVQGIVEKLLMVSGEDSINIKRKHKTGWEGPLSSRVVILSNEAPQLGDSSGALTSRFITLSINETFYGREDPGLLARLVPELPAIFRWALEGRDRLKARGYFVQPQCGVDDAEDMADMSSPISLFVQEKCELKSVVQTPVHEVFEAWCAWCAGQGRDHPGTVQMFSRSLRAAHRSVRTVRKMTDGESFRVFEGLRVKNYELSV